MYNDFLNGGKAPKDSTIKLTAVHNPNLASDVHNIIMYAENEAIQYSDLTDAVAPAMSLALLDETKSSPVQENNKPFLKHNLNFYVCAHTSRDIR